MKSTYIPRGCDQQGRYASGFILMRKTWVHDLLSLIRRFL